MTSRGMRGDCSSTMCKQDSSSLFLQQQQQDDFLEIPQYTPQASLANNDVLSLNVDVLTPLKPTPHAELKPTGAYFDKRYYSWLQRNHENVNNGANSIPTSRAENYEECYSIKQLESDIEFFRLFELNSETLGIFGTARTSKKRCHNKQDEDTKKHHTGRAVLHEAIDRHTMSPRVVKVIDKSRLPASAGGESLWRRLCAKLLQLSPKHSGLMSVMDVFETPETFYIVTEKLEGGELFEFLLHEKAVPEELCKYVIKQILHALDFLHCNDLLHRDVKPENLMFRRARPTVTDTSTGNNPNSTSLSLASTTTSLIFDPLAAHEKQRLMSSLECSQALSLEELARSFELALIDFDTCKMTDLPSSEYREVCNGRRRLVGTYGYLAPEVLRGHEYTRVSDLWSVGVILYILMTGVPPVPMDLMVNARASLDVLQGVKRDGIDFNLPPFPDFPKAQHLCKLFLDFDPSRRIPSARQALEHPWLNPPASNAVPFPRFPFSDPVAMKRRELKKQSQWGRSPTTKTTDFNSSNQDRSLLLVNTSAHNVDGATNGFQQSSHKNRGSARFLLPPNKAPALDRGLPPLGFLNFQ